jgi:hypothetical protein
MNHIRRLTGVLAGLAGILVAFGAAAPSALAVHVPPLADPAARRRPPRSPSSLAACQAGRSP